ncbi:MAG: hypothetical protein KAV00_17030 [Phycisphaerae bacterium]|nr:hypothetical protein [Phycisphaerae bacterium]
MLKTRKRRMVHYGQCPDCGHSQRVKRLDWHKKTPPRCPKCGGTLRRRIGICLPPPGCVE